MSRSKRKTPICGMTTASSEQKDKRLANRRLRKMTKVAIRQDAEIMPVLDDVSNPWLMGKDGKQYLRNPSWENMGK